MALSVICFLNIGGGEMGLIVLAIITLFGTKQIPEIARTLGKTIREFRSAMDGVKKEISDSMNMDEPLPAAKPTAAVEKPEEIKPEEASITEKKVE
ncbi:MAG: twin-arginine translocase TatA/TatE family subunit [Bacteroidota bacterium]